MSASFGHAASPEPDARPAPARPTRASSSAAARSILHQWDLAHSTWDALLASAEALDGPLGRTPLLAGRRVGMLLLNSSLRTRLSMEAACQDLGAKLLAVEPGQGVWGLELRDEVAMEGEAAEHVREAVGVLGGLVDVLGVRVFGGLGDAADDAAEPLLRAVAAAALSARLPLLSLESALDHPHQALADALVLRRRFGGSPATDSTVAPRKLVLSWAPHIKPLPLAVPHAALTAMLRDGHQVTLAHPEGFELDPQVVARAQALGSERGGSLTITHDRDAALHDAHIVYAKAWGARALYGDDAAARAAVRGHADWRVRAPDLECGDEAAFMHCLPVRRGVVVDAEVLDGPRSLVQLQAAARLPVQKATLCHALGVRT